jgi:4'-phosphopantetheinyl transferase
MNSSQPMQSGPGEIHLWLIDLNAGNRCIQTLLTYLSDDEMERASRLRIPKMQNHFTVARGVMRKILGESLSADPRSLDFIYGPHGKPELKNPDHAEVHFNLSHSSDLGFLAINSTYPIGVDIETIRPGRPFLKLAERFFSVMESGALKSLPEDEVMEAFYSCWTRKEAYLKAIGTGLATPLNAFDVTLKPGDTPALIGQRLDPSETARWDVLDIDVPSGYRAAVVTRWKLPRLIIRQWEAET